MIAKGIVHCHSELSYDCHISLSELREALLSQGYQFVALTDHDRGVAASDFQRLVSECEALSDRDFVLIPGIEMRCPEGVEIAGVGLAELPAAGDPEDVVSQVRALGGFAIWVHPLKRGRGDGRLLDCDAVEVLNGKLDGRIAPNFKLLRRVLRDRENGRSFHVIFGADFHDLQAPLNVWVECEVETLTDRAIVESLKAGRYMCRVARGRMTSSGVIKVSDRARMVLLQWASRVWNGLLDSVPGSMREPLVRRSKPLIRRILRGRGSVS